MTTSFAVASPIMRSSSTALTVARLLKSQCAPTVKKKAPIIASDQPRYAPTAAFV